MLAFKVASVIANAIVHGISVTPKAIYDFVVSLPSLLSSIWQFFLWIVLVGIPSAVWFVAGNWLTILIAALLIHFAVRFVFMRLDSQPVEYGDDEFLRGSSVESDYATDDVFQDSFDTHGDWDEQGDASWLFPNRRWATGFEISRSFEWLKAFARGLAGK